ncbi:MAG: FAD-dependent thymidylate synthase [Candidatus Komeilibacteria bacterium]|nr:FAD-dependent thymidylate synthase [Candidatus Komeilibacteria bacterium]
MAFTHEEKKLLEPYVTSVDGDIFSVKAMHGMVGAAYARYSRAKGGFREVLLKEFIKEGVIDPVHAAELIERILIAYGDDSVGELEGAHVSFENISIVATKEIEERRIGGSPIEQSTRYVFYDQKINDKYRYYREPRIMASPFAAEYEATLDFVFDTYCELIEPMKTYYQGLKAMDDAEYDINADGVKEKYADLTDPNDQKAFRVTYNADLRTKACDTLRALLPIATQTNVGIFGNGRFFQNVVTALYTSPFTEANQIGDAAFRELNKVIPAYVKRAKRNEYLIANHAAMQAIVDELLGGVAPQRVDENIDLLDYGDDAITERLKEEPDFNASTVRHARQIEFDVFTITCMLYPYARHPFRQLRHIVRKLSEAHRMRIAAAYVGNRTTRRDRPYRAFESGYPYTFDLVTDFGTYKDLMRHRMNTQLRQRFSPLLGFAMPPDLEIAGHADKARECHVKVAALYEKMVPTQKEEASYVTLHGNYVRWLMGMNDREAFHLLELRTTPQGHPSYRKASQLMHQAIRKQSAWRADAMNFVDYNEYFWARGDAEARQRAKERTLEERLKKEKGEI